jgi:hypothetical protein
LFLDIYFFRKGLPSIVFWFCNCCVPLTLFTRTLVINIGLSFYMQCFVDSPFLPLYCLSFDIRLLITPLVYSNFSRRNRWFVDKKKLYQRNKLNILFLVLDITKLILKISRGGEDWGSLFCFCFCCIVYFVIVSPLMRTYTICDSINK